MTELHKQSVSTSLLISAVTICPRSIRYILTLRCESLYLDNSLGPRNYGVIIGYFVRSMSGDLVDRYGVIPRD